MSTYAASTASLNLPPPLSNDLDWQTLLFTFVLEWMRWMRKK